MIDNFLLVSTQVWELFALIGAGALCRKAGWLGEGSIKGIVNLLVLLVAPCLIVDVFQRPYDPAMLRHLGEAFLAAIAAHVAVMVFATVAIRTKSESRRPVLRLAAAFSNAGFMGIPLEHAILGDNGVFFGISYVVVFNLFFWSWGLMQMKKGGGGGRKFDPAFIVNPGTIGLAVGLGLFLCGIELPKIVAEPVEMMAALNTPLAMVVIGYYLAGADLRPILRLKGAYLAGFTRLVLYPLAFVAALYPFREALHPDMMIALTIAASAPVAAMVAMFSAKYGRDVDLGVGLVSATTLASIVTMPAVIAVAMSLLRA